MSPAEIVEIRVLLESLRGFTPGPWRVAYTAGQGGIDSHKVYTDAIGPNPVCVGEVNRWQPSLADQKLFAAAPDLYGRLTKLADEVERMLATL